MAEAAGTETAAARGSGLSTGVLGTEDMGWTIWVAAGVGIVEGIGATVGAATGAVDAGAGMGMAVAVGDGAASGDGFDVDGGMGVGMNGRASAGCVRGEGAV